MYDRSVWLQEVDQGLYDLITSVVTYPDENGLSIPVEPIFPLDSADLKDLELPTVIIRHLGETFDMDRYDPNHTEIVVGYNEEKTVAYLENMAKPYILQYQLDFVSEYKEDMNQMLKMWHGNIDKRHNLSVSTTEGVETTSYMYLVQPPKTLNQQKGDKKLYRTVFLYNIKVELDLGKTREQKVAVNVNVDINR